MCISVSSSFLRFLRTGIQPALMRVSKLLLHINIQFICCKEVGLVFYSCQYIMALYLHITIYIYMCVCVCVCVWLGTSHNVLYSSLFALQYITRVEDLLLVLHREVYCCLLLAPCYINGQRYYISNKNSIVFVNSQYIITSYVYQK